jgi:hypothetical protein
MSKYLPYSVVRGVRSAVDNDKYYIFGKKAYIYTYSANSYTEVAVSGIDIMEPIDAVNIPGSTNLLFCQEDSASKYQMHVFDHNLIELHK